MSLSLSLLYPSILPIWHSPHTNPHSSSFSPLCSVPFSLHLSLLSSFPLLLPSFSLSFSLSNSLAPSFSPSFPLQPFSTVGLNHPSVRAVLSFSFSPYESLFWPPPLRPLSLPFTGAAFNLHDIMALRHGYYIIYNMYPCTQHFYLCYNTQKPLHS